MPELIVEIIRYVDDAQPGWIECRFKDASGKEHSILDKVPIFTSAVLDQSSAYPQPGALSCREVQRRRNSDGREVVTVDTEHPDHVESSLGETYFDVFAAQLGEC